ncbi:MAG: hypothetical protein V1794_10405, partial [Candidatus Glassbacteria bacterium]
GSNAQFRRLLVQLSLDCISSGGQIFFCGQPVDYGRPVSLQLLGQQLQGVVTARDRLPAEVTMVWKEVRVIYSSIQPWIVEKLEPGLQEYAPDRPVNIRFKQVLTDQPAVIYPNSQNDRVSPAYHPLFRDITCLMEIHLTLSDNMYYFNGSPFVLGSRVSFITPAFTIQGEVIDF